MSSSRDAIGATSADPSVAWHNALGQKLSAARLAELPAGLLFDNALDEPIWYDAPRKLLCYRGFMCNASYVILRRLSDDARYIQALELLYFASAVEDQPRGSLLKRAASLALAAAALAAGAWYWLR